MASSAIGRELGCNVVGIGRLRIIGVVASIAGIGRIGIVAIVAAGAIVGDGRMRTIQRIIIVVCREGSRCPPSGRGMAHRTIGRNTQRSMVGIVCLQIIGIMATIASIGRIGVIPVVAGSAIIGNTGMRTRKRVKTIMVKG